MTEAVLRSIDCALQDQASTWDTSPGLGDVLSERFSAHAALGSEGAEQPRSCLQFD